MAMITYMVAETLKFIVKFGRKAQPFLHRESYSFWWRVIL